MPRVAIDQPKFLRPFFTYFGGKWRIAPKYPPPTHRTIVESHAGSAGYSLRYYWHDVELYDVDPIVFGVWDYLIRTPRNEILALPDISVGETVDDYAIPQEAKWLIGFWLNKGVSSPAKTRSAWARGSNDSLYWGQSVRERIASQHPCIRHWKVRLRGYDSIDNISATWFVDPPYETAGKDYRFSKTNYAHLADWCRHRRGQVIVCENDGATWLPFVHLVSANANNSCRIARRSHESIWINDQ